MGQYRVISNGKVYRVQKRWLFFWITLQDLPINFEGRVMIDKGRYSLAIENRIRK